MGVVHSVLTILLAYWLIGLASCNEPKLASGDLGEEVSAQEIETQLQSVFSDLSPKTVQKDQAVAYEINYRVIGFDSVKKVMDQIIQVMKTEDTGTVRKVWLGRVDIDYNTNPPVETVTEDTDELYIPPEPEAPQNSSGIAQSMQLHDFSLSRFQSQAKALAERVRINEKIEGYEERRPIRYSYHNLMIQKDLTTDPPQAVSSKPGCGGLAQCSLRFHLVEFDEVEWYSEDEFQKTKYQIEISPDSPYYGHVLSSCNVYMVTRYAVRACQVLRDFIF